MIDLKFLGYGAAFNPKFGNTSAYFTIGDAIYFLDFGESVFQTVYSEIPLEKYSRAYVLITHLHSDHVGSLSSMLSYMYYVHHVKVNVIHPSEALVDLLTLQGTNRDIYRFMSVFPQSEPVSVRFVSVEHMENMESFGLIVEDGDSRIYYSGDSTDLPREILKDFLNGKIDRLYQDTASHESICHCCYKKLAGLIPEELRKNVYCMHLDSNCQELLRNNHFSVVTELLA